MENIIKFKKDEELIVVGNCFYENFKEYISQGYEVSGDSPLVPVRDYVYKHIREMYNELNKKEIDLPMYINNGSLLNPNGYNNKGGFSILENLSINDIGFHNGYSDLSIKQKISKEFISKEELKEKIKAIDIKHISSNEMFRIEVLYFIEQL